MDAASGMLGLCKALLVLQKHAAPAQRVGLERLKSVLSQPGEDTSEDMEVEGGAVPEAAQTPEGEQKEVLRALVARKPTRVDDVDGKTKEPLMVAVHSVAWTGVAGHAILSEYWGKQPPRPKPQPLKIGASSAAAAQANARDEAGAGKGRKKTKAGGRQEKLAAVVVVDGSSDDGVEGEDENHDTGGPAENGATPVPDHKPLSQEETQVSESNSGNSSACEDKEDIAPRMSISWEERLVFPRLVGYQWWLGQHQLPVPPAEEEEEEDDEDEPEPEVLTKDA
jgi:hypothetical protein